MNFKKFMELYDNWNTIAIINDDTLKPIVKDVAWKIAEDRTDLYEKEVVSFGFYDGELTVRVK
ncbi:MAG: hypothetical protein IJA10_10780 [Lachnospiraceae bacterium]|nr:hypothetical protein [Lachnospiraceae bacterium]